MGPIFTNQMCSYRGEAEEVLRPIYSQGRKEEKAMGQLGQRLE